MPKIKKKNRKSTEKSKKARKKPKILKLPKMPKKALFFLGHSVQDCLKRTLVYMGTFFIEAIKKSQGIKILSLVLSIGKHQAIPKVMP